jgi:type I restriction enzyme, S subunit
VVKDWKLKTLKEVAEVQSGGTPLRSKNEYWSGDIPWYSSGELNEIFTKISKDFITKKGIDESNAKLFPKGSLFIGMYDTAALKMSILDRDAAFNQAIAGVKPNQSIDLKFVLYAINSRKIEILNQRRGVRQKNLSLAKIKDISLFIPLLHEQKRIVAILDEVFEEIDRAIANTEKNLTNARELFESYRNSLLTQTVKEWGKTTLGAEINLMTGFPFKSNQYTESDQSIRLLRGDNIVQGALRWDDVKKWPESEIDEFLTYQLKEGDVVLAMDRPWVKAGLKHAIISQDDLPCLLVQRTACLRGAENIEHRFLMYLIGSHTFIRHILSNQTGIGVPHISGKQIQSFQFLKPPISDQIFISDSLDELRSKKEHLEAIYKQKLAALKELKQSILQKAFTGELTADTANQVTKQAKEATLVA